MAQQVKPYEQLEFHGVYTAGNPTARPRGSAAKCQNFRVMPGYWLRLAGGRKARYCTAGEVRQIHLVRGVDFFGGNNQLAQLKFVGDTAAWHWFNLSGWVCAPPEMQSVTQIETIATAYDGGFALTYPAAAANISDRPVMYNGLGVRDGFSSSKPPFTHYKDGAFYYGLDAYCPGGNPEAAFAGGDGYNQIQERVEVWVGLYSSATGHYSNAVYAGTVETTSGLGTITVSNLGRLKFASHGAGEQATLHYVFYATIDGGRIPYLILNTALNGPNKVAVSEDSASLSLASGTTNGWNLDLTSEGPFDNHPPRPMRSLCYVNGRLYGVLLQGGSGTAVSQLKPGASVAAPDFTYQAESADLAAVVWSKASNEPDPVLGDPLQCWPTDYITPTPSGDQPVVVAPAQDGVRVLVVTPGSTFLLEESADGLQEWVTVSRIHGISMAASLRTTPYGTAWVSQRNQIVLLPPGGERLEVLSGTYQNLLAGKTVRCADYLLDPVNEMDRYQVWFSDGTTLIHDFAVGEAYTATGHDFTAAATVYNASGKPHHIVAKAGLYTHEGQPEDGLIPTTNQTFTGSGQAYTGAEIDGEYIRNWDDLGDMNLRKELPQADVVADGALSAQLGVSPFSLEWYADFEQVIAGNKKTAALTKTGQSATDSCYRARLATPHRFWFKIVLKLRGHSTDDAAFTKHRPPAEEGDNAKNFYGSILRFLLHAGVTENRA